MEGVGLEGLEGSDGDVEAEAIVRMFMRDGLCRDNDNNFLGLVLW